LPSALFVLRPAGSDGQPQRSSLTEEPQVETRGAVCAEGARPLQALLAGALRAALGARGGIGMSAAIVINGEDVSPWVASLVVTTIRKGKLTEVRVRFAGDVVPDRIRRALADFEFVPDANREVSA